MRGFLVVAALSLPAAAAQKAPETFDQIVSRVEKIDFVKFCPSLGKMVRAKGLFPVDAEGKAYLVRAKKEFGIKHEELVEIVERRPMVGGTVCGALAAWGRPQHSNVTHTARGYHAQLVYGLKRYVYIDNEVITAYSE